MRIKRVRALGVRWAHGPQNGYVLAVRSDGAMLVRWCTSGYMRGHESWMRREELVVAKARVRAVAA